MNKQDKLSIIKSAARLVSKYSGVKDFGVCDGLREAVCVYLDTDHLHSKSEGYAFVKSFQDLFSPVSPPNIPNLFFFDQDEDGYADFNKERVLNSRLLALAFLYALVEEGEL